jgi:signal transduction histidine kinase
MYFLAAVGVLFIGFSLTILLLVRAHMSAQLDHRLDTTMHALIAAIEIHSDDVEWEPLERRIKIGDDPSLEQPRWTVRDLSGNLIDGSSNLGDGGLETIRATSQWRATSCLIRAGQFSPQPHGNPKELIPEKIQLPKDRTFRGNGLWLTAAISERPMFDSLSNLAITLAAVSSLIWLTAALWGRWLCRQALQPIMRMAKSARAIRLHSPQESKLDVPTTNDELEDLGVAFNDLLGDLRESLDRQRRFTGDASHQLRTPLSAMIAAVDVALRQDRSPEEYRRVLNTIRRRGGQLTQIIETLLFLARPDRTSMLLASEDIDLAEWCRAWLEGWQGHPRAADIVFQPDEGPFLIHTYPSLLGQILDNLLDNACKYSDPGTRLTIRLRRQGETITLAVADRGYGIDEADRERVFEPFFRSEKARWLGKPGTGLGLTVVRRLVTVLGGTIDVTSTPGQGSEFRIHIPKAADTDLPVETKRSQGDHVSNADESKSAAAENKPGIYKCCSESVDSTLRGAKSPAPATVNMGNLQ